MVNVQAFVTVMMVTSSLSMVCLIMALIILVRISLDVERICHYSIDIFDIVKDIKFRCIYRVLREETEAMSRKYEAEYESRQSN